MSRPPLEVADIFRQYGPAFLSAQGDSLSAAQRRVMQAIELCRTAALGGHVEECDSCRHLRIFYNSCRNRHCPKCQSLAKAQWLEERQAELLPVQYFHVVFTIPACLAPVALENKRIVYNILFRAASQTLLRIAADPRHLGASVGFLAVLHTWGQNLLHHPHLHCVVPGGGLSPDGLRWISCRKDFFLSVRVLSRLFRRLFLDHLQQAFANGKLEFHQTLQHLSDPAAFTALVRSVRQTEWVVYAKPPFGGPAQVLDYLGHYTHRVAISNDRLLSIDNNKVTFRWRDYRHGNNQATMSLAADEFIRRFLLHVLPRGFQRIRHFGLLSNRHREVKLARCRCLLGVVEDESKNDERLPSWKERLQTLTGYSLDTCPACGVGRMQLVELLFPVLSSAHPP